MTGSSFGKILKLSTWGESHGDAIGCVLDGVPSGIKISKDEKLRKKIGRKGREKYLKYFNSTLVADFIINKTLSLDTKKKYLWFNDK